MSKPFKRTTVTAALIYANGPIHIGHIAGCYLPADIYVRYLRATGQDVKFISGTDEHGVPITIKAKKEGVTPQEVVDKYYGIIKDSFEEFGISFDIYSRTSNKVHHDMSQDIFKNIYDKGQFVEETTEQYYDEKAQTFLADRYIIGTCPKCGNENAYGDQCERCGSTLSPTELINPRSALSGEKPVMKETKNWYLPLDVMQPALEKYVESHPEWKTNVMGQVKSWLNDGLKPRAMTRDLDWGIKVPLPDTEGKVMYVWFDAPIGYISMTKELTEDWEKYWKDEDTRLVHFIGKDNIVFHCLIFPAMCMADGRFILADNVPANEFMNLEGDKISTSRNWAVWLHEYLREFEGKQDILRYVLAASAPETKDSDFTWSDFQIRNNSELVGIFGNFINRAVVLTEKNFEGKVPKQGALNDYDKQVLATLADMPAKIGDSIANYRFREALALMMDVARLGNKYLADTEPWKVIKTDVERTGTILNIGLQIAANLSIVAEPFLPFTAEKIRTILNTEAFGWSEAGRADLLAEGQAVTNVGLLFEKVEDATVAAQVQKLEDAKQLNLLAGKEVTPLKEEIQYDDFAKMDIRIGTIIEAEKVAKSKKLLKLKIEDGIKQRTILSGIGEHFQPENIIGQQVSFLANLAPRKMMGMESEGMILMAEDKDGSLAFVQPSKKVWDGGTVA
ncbi:MULTISPECIES: methionine--tRNA ligase [unclassified Arcicella]|uniref:methionine--tRNA ligase n=1 Tax=unclassified Arcicella TaxID=2644986 RepID=UPI002865BD52|nr:MULTISPECIES: methionine--tRNA ligase [unclassified Arcicella]MDR6564768.1 methionyl-tRNA synthetase [Arcicella sp. BE51]MDR6814564.1 methionyl-tRNA synthetase [Arcicella sp. BE140]MDR6825942.1 methionyl-tRNA synthetase [Arcicella sp. BE139]